MDKNEFVQRVAAESGLSRKDAANAVDAVVKSIEDALRSGDDVSLSGFGKFHVAERGARRGRNPRTGEPMAIAASKVPRFTASSGMKQSLRGPLGAAGSGPRPGPDEDGWPPWGA